MERAVFARYIREALAHLDEPACLEGHPLAGLLAQETGSASADRLRHFIVSAVEQLKPPETVSRDSPAWRRYRHLVLRYVQGYPLHRTARELQVSVRQARRDHDAAVAAVVSILWQRCRRHQEQGAAALATPSQPEEDSTDSRSILEAELAKIGSVEPEGPTEVEETVRGVLFTVARLAEERGVSIESSIPDTLSPVAVNQVALRQILLGLLSYAIELDAGSRLVLTAADAPESVELRLSLQRKRGVGTAETGPRSAPTEAEALLVASQKLLEMQGGTLQLASPRPGALLLSLNFPASPLTTILVVDDNPDMVRLFRRFLKGCGYRLIHAGEARRALSLARDSRPNVIILDVLMPSQDGWQILHDLKSCEETGSIPVIICSVVPGRALALSLGVSEFLPKPISQQALLAALERCNQPPEECSDSPARSASPLRL